MVNHMGGICERPGCSRNAAAAVALDPRRGIVWIGDLETSIDSVNALCAAHADTLGVPVGWERRDVRDAPRLFAVPSGPPAPEPTPPRPRRSMRKGAPSRRAAATGAQLDLTADRDAERAGAEPARAAADRSTDRDDALVAEHPPSPDRTLAELHHSGARVSAATAELLRPGGDTPLLARAFRFGRAAG
jgi:hypothetical protein